MADYIPSNEGDRILWLGHFAAWMNGHGAAHGFTHAEVSRMYFKASHLRSVVDIQATQQAGGGSPRLSGGRAGGDPCQEGSSRDDRGIGRGHGPAAPS